MFFTKILVPVSIKSEHFSDFVKELQWWAVYFGKKYMHKDLKKNAVPTWSTHVILFSIMIIIKYFYVIIYLRSSNGYYFRRSRRAIALEVRY